MEQIKSMDQLKYKMATRLSKILAEDVDVLWEDLLSSIATAFDKLSDEELKKATHICISYYTEKEIVYRAKEAKVRIEDGPEIAVELENERDIGDYEKKQALLQKFFARVEDSILEIEPDFKKWDLVNLTIEYPVYDVLP